MSYTQHSSSIFIYLYPCPKSTPCKHLTEIVNQMLNIKFDRMKKFGRDLCQIKFYITCFFLFWSILIKICIKKSKFSFYAGIIFFIKYVMIDILNFIIIYADAKNSLVLVICTSRYCTNMVIETFAYCFLMNFTFQDPWYM